MGQFTDKILYNEELLDKFVYEWMNSREWRGANLFPYLKILNEEYSFILKKTLEFIKTQQQYKENSYLYIDSSNGEEICSRMHEYSNSLKRKNNDGKHLYLFRKIEYNFLKHLGLIEAKNGKYVLTPEGEIFSNMSSFKDMKDFFKDLFIKLTWYERPHYKVHPIQMLFKLLENLNNISYDEYKFIIIHATSDSQLEEIVNLIKIYRNSPHKKEEYDKYLIKTKTEIEIANFNKIMHHYLADISIIDEFKYDLETDNLILLKCSKTEKGKIFKEPKLKQSELKNSIKSKEGYIYILRNAIFRDEVFKIGFSINSEERAKQMSKGTGVPDNFFVVQKFKTINMILAENIVFKILESYRVNNNREFFQISLEELIDKITKIVSFINLVENKISITAGE